MESYPNFYEYFQMSKGMIQAEISACDDLMIEYRFPIITFSNIMGYIYNGIEKKSEGAILYMYAISRRGDKTKRNSIAIESDLKIESYNKVIQDLSLELMKDQKFMMISTGGRY